MVVSSMTHDNNGNANHVTLPELPKMYISMDHYTKVSKMNKIRL